MVYLKEAFIILIGMCQMWDTTSDFYFFEGENLF